MRHIDRKTMFPGLSEEADRLCKQVAATVLAEQVQEMGELTVLAGQEGRIVLARYLAPA